MKKFILLAAIATSLTAIAHAQQVTDNFSGVYAGVKVGGNNSTGKFLTTKKSGGAFEGAVLLGYGTLMDKAYLGGEVSVGYDGTSITASPTSPNPTFKLTKGLNAGVTGRLGYQVVPNALVYLSAGVVVERIKTRTVKTTTSTTPVTQTITSNTTQNVGIVPGIGTQFAINDHVSLRGDLTYQVPRTVGNVKVNKTAFTLGLTCRF